MCNALFSFLSHYLASVSGSAAVQRDEAQFSTPHSTQPAVNIDGSPMVGHRISTEGYTGWFPTMRTRAIARSNRP